MRLVKGWNERELISHLLTQIESLGQKVEVLLARQPIEVQEFYSTADVAKLLAKAEWTVREWCRLGRIHGEKRRSGRGASKEWMISHDELLRIRSEGLLPLDIYSHSRRV